MSQPIPAVRVKPGEYFLAAETIKIGDRFQYLDSVYEVVGEPRRWGAGWMTLVEIIEGYKPGARFQAMLRTGHQVEG